MRGKIGSIGLRDKHGTLVLHAMIRKIVGTRAETLVDEQNHNCSPILSIVFVFSLSGTECVSVCVCSDVSRGSVAKQLSTK